MEAIQVFVLFSAVLMSITVAEQPGSLVADWLAKQSSQFERSQMEKNGEVFICLIQIKIIIVIISTVRVISLDITDHPPK